MRRTILTVQKPLDLIGQWKGAHADQQSNRLLR